MVKIRENIEWILYTAGLLATLFSGVYVSLRYKDALVLVVSAVAILMIHFGVGIMGMRWSFLANKGLEISKDALGMLGDLEKAYEQWKNSDFGDYMAVHFIKVAEEVFR